MSQGRRHLIPILSNPPIKRDIHLGTLVLHIPADVHPRLRREPKSTIRRADLALLELAEFLALAFPPCFSWVQDLSVFCFCISVIWVCCEIEEGENRVEDGASGVFDEELEIGEGSVLGWVGLDALWAGLLDLDGEVLKWGWVYRDLRRRYWCFFWRRWARTVGFEEGPVDVGGDTQFGIT